MSILKGILYVFAALFVLSGLFVFLPWTTLNGFMTAFDAPAYPADAIVQYTVRAFFIIIFWVGVLLALAVREPVKLQAALAVIAGMCLTCGVACLAMGWIYALPAFFYLDAVSGLVIGALILAYRHCALTGGSEESAVQAGA